MKRLYEKCREPGTSKDFWVGVGWICEDPSCRSVMIDENFD